ncbi:MAG TPA: lysophospholipid acyltransferase family protein [Chloroflexota bacterium]|nr:lysophospholipid acyltransferase family protein [Chloroflexota bacterium]
MLLRAGVAVAERAPGAPLYALGRAIAPLLAATPSGARNRLRRNLARASGESLGSRRLDSLVREAYVTQVANYLDLLRYRRISVEEIARTYVATGPGWEPFLAAGRAGKGAVLVTAHFGRIERLNHFLAQFQLPTTLPVERLQPERLFELVCSLRAHRGVNLVPHDAGLRPCLRALSRGHVVALFAEWDPTGRGVPVSLFGAEAHLPPGPAFLALRSGAPLFVGLDLPGDEPGHHQGYLEPPIEIPRSGDLERDVGRVTQAIAALFERHLARDPGRWVMFHDIFRTDVSQSAPLTGREALPHSDR